MQSKLLYRPTTGKLMSNSRRKGSPHALRVRTVSINFATRMVCNTDSHKTTQNLFRFGLALASLEKSCSILLVSSMLDASEN